MTTHILNGFKVYKFNSQSFYVFIFRNIKFLLQNIKLELENYTPFVNMLIFCDICILAYLFISIASYISMKQYINILAPIYHRIMQEGQ